MKRELHLNLFIHGRGHHEASWRHPASSSLALTDIDYYQDLAQRAEAALFDLIFFADQLALGGDVAQAPRTWLEPITVLAAIAMVTKRVGLIATASTTYTEPFNLARQFASIDHISKGRAAWNIVTSWLATAAENYGGSGQVSHADRYARGEEFMEVVKGLWDSWAADAVVDDRAAGLYAKPDRIRSIKHRGDFYTVAGPLNMPRCPQGRPVLVQAGSSDTGRRFAARHADAVFTAHMAKSTAQEFDADLKTLAAAEGRRPEHVLILPGLSPVIAATETDAQRLARDINELTDPEVGRSGCQAALAAMTSRICRLIGRCFGGFSSSRIGGGGAQPHGGHPQPGQAGQADFAPTPRLPGRCAGAFRDCRHAGTDCGPDRGLGHRWRRGRVQHHASDTAGVIRRVRQRGRSDSAAARPVPYRVQRDDAARALWFALACKRV